MVYFTVQRIKSNYDLEIKGQECLIDILCNIYHSVVGIVYPVFFFFTKKLWLRPPEKDKKAHFFYDFIHQILAIL